LRAIVKSLQGKLDELRLHCVYGFWTKSGELFYVGQTTDFEVRIYDHMQHQGKKVKFKHPVED
jgi:predicted GIY-YIG superfamily endonuclease